MTFIPLINTLGYWIWYLESPSSYIKSRISNFESPMILMGFCYLATSRFGVQRRRKKCKTFEISQNLPQCT